MNKCIIRNNESNKIFFLLKKKKKSFMKAVARNDRNKKLGTEQDIQYK